MQPDKRTSEMAFPQTHVCIHWYIHLSSSTLSLALSLGLHKAETNGRRTYKNGNYHKVINASLHSNNHNNSKNSNNNKYKKDNLNFCYFYCHARKTWHTFVLSWWWRQHAYASCRGQSKGNQATITEKGTNSLNLIIKHVFINELIS